MSNQPTPEEARRADQPETLEQVKQQLLEMKLALSQYRELHSICKRFINKNKLRSREDFASLQAQRFLIQDICECIGYEP